MASHTSPSKLSYLPTHNHNQSPITKRTNAGLSGQNPRGLFHVKKPITYGSSSYHKVAAVPSWRGCDRCCALSTAKLRASLLCHVEPAFSLQRSNRQTQSSLLWSEQQQRRTQSTIRPLAQLLLLLIATDRLPAFAMVSTSTNGVISSAPTTNGAPVGDQRFVSYITVASIREYHLTFPFIRSVSKKQGAYGKIKTHSESKISQLLHLDEVWAALYLLYVNPLQSNMHLDNEDVTFCNEILVAVSRSFAAVIRQLPEESLLDVAFFYLVLRALDTVEDDMTAFESHEKKVKELLQFSGNALQNPEWSMDGVGQGDERRLLQEFPKAHRVYAGLNPRSQEIIADITQRMAEGMAEYVGKDLGQGTLDIPEYNRYCHFVAGLVGEGLSRLFSASKLENASLAGELKLSDQMGLFLQKTNIIRDFLEDYVDKRAFWPQSVWKKYSGSGDLGYFCQQSDPIVKERALECLDELVIDALGLVPDCLAYMSKLQCTEIFRFCAIPQVMAIATLEKCYNNPDVFTGVVKIRKGLSCRLILRTNNLHELHQTFYEFASKIRRRCLREKAPHAERTIQVCDRILDLTKQSRPSSSPVPTSALVLGAAAVAAIGLKRTSSVVPAMIAVSAVLLVQWSPWSSSPPNNLKPAKELKKSLL